MNKYKARLKDINSLEFAESKAKSRLSLIRRSMVRCQRPLSRPVFSLPLKPPYLIFSCLSQPPKPLANSHAISTRTGTLSPMIAPHLCRESYQSTRRWEQSVETLSLLLSDVPDQHVHRHLSLFGPDLSQALQWLAQHHPVGDPDHCFSCSATLSEPKMSSPKALPAPALAFWEPQTHLIELPCLQGASRLHMHLCLACWAAGEGQTWHSTVSTGLDWGAERPLCLDLPPVILRGMLLLLFGDEIQAGAAQDCGAGVAELPHSSQLTKKSSNWAKRVFGGAAACAL